MAWETRGSNIYYYRKKRIAGKVISQYVGRGCLAEQAALMDLRQRGKREIAKQEREEPELLYQHIAGISLIIRQVVESILIISGFHKHKGQWRRRRDAGS